MIKSHKNKDSTVQVVFRLQEALNHRSIVDSLGGKTEAFDWLKMALSVEDVGEFRKQMEWEGMHNNSLYNGGYIPGKLLVFRFKGAEDEGNSLFGILILTIFVQP